MTRIRNRLARLAAAGLAAALLSAGGVAVANATPHGTDGEPQTLVPGGGNNNPGGPETPPGGGNNNPGGPETPPGGGNKTPEPEKTGPCGDCRASRAAPRFTG